MFAIVDSSINFAPTLGIPIHGIIGYDVFKDFIVEVNYSRKFIKLYNPKTYSPKLSKKWRASSLKFYNKKPIIEANVTVNEREVPVNLLIDTGGSDALWLFEDSSPWLPIPKQNFNDFLGKGLSGSIFGKRAVLESFRLSDFQLHKVNVAFPDASSINKTNIHGLRNGSLLGDVLHRFNWVFDYRSQKVRFKKNKYFKAPFKYNKSGIVMQYAGVRLVKKQIKTPNGFTEDTSNLNASPNSNTINFSYRYKLEIVPELIISDLRPNSPALNAGLQIGDVVLSINTQDLSALTLQKAIEQFYGKDGKLIRMTIDRDGVLFKYEFRLRDLLQKKSTN
ncbi:PDZ domain-containing protein [Flavobacteriaceae bacterium]|nr:PDZ domain-containing protein [Flavobacteriaceae bacterium]